MERLSPCELCFSYAELRFRLPVWFQAALGLLIAADAFRFGVGGANLLANVDKFHAVVVAVRNVVGVYCLQGRIS